MASLVCFRRIGVGAAMIGRLKGKSITRGRGLHSIDYKNMSLAQMSKGLPVQIFTALLPALVRPKSL